MQEVEQCATALEDCFSIADARLHRPQSDAVTGLHYSFERLAMYQEQLAVLDEVQKILQVNKLPFIMIKAAVQKGKL